jgi:hypothetical protein
MLNIGTRTKCCRSGDDERQLITQFFESVVGCDSFSKSVEIMILEFNELGTIGTLDQRGIRTAIMVGVHRKSLFFHVMASSNAERYLERVLKIFGLFPVVGGFEFQEFRGLFLRSV